MTKRVAFFVLLFVTSCVPTLFYTYLFSRDSSILTDGNFDDFSQHAAKPIIDGEKVRGTCLLLRFLICIIFLENASLNHLIRFLLPLLVYTRLRRFELYFCLIYLSLSGYVSYHFDVPWPNNIDWHSVFLIVAYFVGFDASRGYVILDFDHHMRFSAYQLVGMGTHL